MLKKLTKEDADYAAERCWALYQDPSSRCYPLYTSGEDMAHSFAVYSEYENGTLLGYWTGDVLAGVCELFFEEETRYLLVTALYAWDAPDAALEAFLSHSDTAAKDMWRTGAAAGEPCWGAALAKHGYGGRETGCDRRAARGTHNRRNDHTGDPAGGQNGRRFGGICAASRRLGAKDDGCRPLAGAAGECSTYPGG